MRNYSITSSDGSTKAVFVPERGAVGASIVVHGANGPRELLFKHDFFENKVWPDLPGGWPFLFPVCARLERSGKRGVYSYAGRYYNLPMHGFAWQQTWQVEEFSRDAITMTLRANKSTLKQYPFKFMLSLRYKVEHNSLICQQTYRNDGDCAMPYYAGFHPYFLTHLAGFTKAQFRIDYQPLQCLQYNESLTDIIGDRKLFKLPASIVDSYLNEKLTKVGVNKKVKLIYPDNSLLEIVASGIEDDNLFPYIQLYTMVNKPFFCIEPWMAFPNAMNSIMGVRWLPAASAEHGLLKLLYYP